MEALRWIILVTILTTRVLDISCRQNEPELCENPDTDSDTAYEWEYFTADDGDDIMDYEEAYEDGDEEEGQLLQRTFGKIPTRFLARASLHMDGTGRFDMLNPEIGPEGEEFTEGDMIMGDAVEEYGEGREEEKVLEDLARKFLPIKGILWPPDPITGLPDVPFAIAKSANRSRALILEAMSLWENATCLTFTELPDPAPENASYINFVRRDGCWSYVGRQFKTQRPQLLSVGSGCRKAGIVAHEIGHSLGLLHEQSRSDRDANVVVVWDNIKKWKWKNFRKRNSHNADVPYDSSSIMHYGGSFFSLDGQLTLVTKNPFHQWHLGQRERLTFRDKLVVNKMYGCLDIWSAACQNETMECQNGGYLNRDCTCQCPNGVEGDQCQYIIGDYYEELSCGGNVTKHTDISTPNFPEFFSDDTWCMWWAQAEKCQQARVTFHSFNLLHRGGDGICFWDRMEIRDDDPIMPGQMYCGCEITKSQQFTSKNGHLFLSFHGKLQHARGFNATIDFVDDPSCENQEKGDSECEVVC